VQAQPKNVYIIRLLALVSFSFSLLYISPITVDQTNGTDRVRSPALVGY